MAPPVVIPNGAGQLTLFITTSPDQDAEMVFGVRAFTDTVQETADNLASTIIADTNMAAFLPTTSSINKVRLTKMTALGLEIAEAAIGVAGTASGTTQAPQVAVLFHKNTGLAGRANRGRTYFPQPAEVRVDNYGLLDATALSTYGTLATAIHDWITDRGIEHVILHTPPLTDPGPPPVYGTAPAPTPVTSMTVDPKVATQRRRVR